MRMIAELWLLLQTTLVVTTSVNSELTDQALGLHPLANPAFNVHQLTPNGIAAAQLAGYLHPLIGSLNISFPSSTTPPTTTTTPTPSETKPCNDSCTVLDLLTQSTRLTKLTTALRSSGLDKILTNSNITVFAPDDAAFESLPDGMFQELLLNTTVLQSILLRHMTRGMIFSADIPASDTPLITGAGEVVTVVSTELATTITSHMAKAEIISPDIEALNGVIHVIDTVI